MGSRSHHSWGVEGSEPLPAPEAPLSADSEASGIPSVKGLKDNWQKWSDERRQYQRQNPFSHEGRPGPGASGAPERGTERYGRPPQGSLTEQRGKDAHVHIGREVQELCQVIRAIGEPREEDGQAVSVTFGKLFEHYVTISNKLVGILLRARKQRLVDFEGEMLWQGKDEQVLITLLQQPTHH